MKKCNGSSQNRLNDTNMTNVFVNLFLSLFAVQFLVGFLGTGKGVSGKRMRHSTCNNICMRKVAEVRREMSAACLKRIASINGTQPTDEL